jgi:hypothetical protein
MTFADMLVLALLLKMPSVDLITIVAIVWALPSITRFIADDIAKNNGANTLGTLILITLVTALAWMVYFNPHSGDTTVLQIFLEAMAVLYVFWIPAFFTSPATRRGRARQANEKAEQELSKRLSALYAAHRECQFDEAALRGLVDEQNAKSLQDFTERYPGRPLPHVASYDELKAAQRAVLARIIP